MSSRACNNCGGKFADGGRIKSICPYCGGHPDTQTPGFKPSFAGRVGRRFLDWPPAKKNRKKEKERRRRARRRQRIYDRDGGRCVSCGATEGLTLDHIRPRSKGGGDSIDNLQTMCKKCNGAKGDSTPDEATRGDV